MGSGWRSTGRARGQWFESSRRQILDMLSTVLKEENKSIEAVTRPIFWVAE